VDRPNTGHRRHDAGSITVVDLIRRHQGQVRIPATDEEATVHLMDDLLGSVLDESDPHRGWLSRSAKLAGLALGSLALCGSVYVASTFTQHRPQNTANESPTTTSVLTGVGALRPDTVAAELSGTAPRTATAAGPAVAGADGGAPARREEPRPGQAQAATGRVVGTIVGRSGPTGTGISSAPPVRSPSAGLTSPIDVVRAFYRLVATDPGMATELLAPSLLTSDAAGFDAAWSALTKINLEDVHQTSPDTVQAVVRMREADGTWLRVVELLHVTGGDAPLISGAELLSAQHG
jgi:hypothetical protein